jgi:hypothetical protein
MILSLGKKVEASVDEISKEASEHFERILAVNIPDDSERLSAQPAPRLHAVKLLLKAPFMNETARAARTHTHSLHRRTARATLISLSHSARC